MQTNFDLNAYGVQEMSHQEMVETDGGIIPIIAAIKVGKLAKKAWKGATALATLGALTQCARGCASGISEGYGE